MNTEETRAGLLEALGEIGQSTSKLAAGQALSNLAIAAGRLEAGGLWDLEDDEALVAARRLLRSDLQH